jgi:hypothetical protein
VNTLDVVVILFNALSMSCFYAQGNMSSGYINLALLVVYVLMAWLRCCLERQDQDKERKGLLESIQRLQTAYDNERGFN